MNRRNRALVFLAAVAAHGAVRAQSGNEPQAQDWPRFHVGVASAPMRSGTSLNLLVSEVGGIPAQIGRDAPVDAGTPRKLVMGFRHLRVVGVELQYIDLGDGSAYQRGPGQTERLQMRGKSDATTVSALLFFPDRTASADFYGKVGFTKLSESFEVSGYTINLPGCVFAANCSFDTRVDSSESVANLGLGARIKIARRWAARIEYEAIDRDEKPVTLLSFGIAAEF